MSEFQRIAFRAIDAPVSAKNLKYMHQQSTRAEITPWAFDNEYSYGDFHGDTLEMMRRGYDFHLHYANFGIRTLLIRCPHGLPDRVAAELYLDNEGLRFIADKQGAGGSLAISPNYEVDHLDELWELEDLIDRLPPLRAEILEGDLRPLYIARLAVALDSEHDPEETVEGPVPAGLGALTDAQRALAEFYGMNTACLAAAAEASPPLKSSSDPTAAMAEWLRSQSTAVKDAWLGDWMADPDSSARGEMLTEFRKSYKVAKWPTVPGNRTMAELEKRTGEILEETARKKAESDAKKRAKHLAAIALDPSPTLQKTEALVLERSGDAYAQIATLLDDLRQACAGTSHAGVAEQQARKLKAEHPTLKMLTSELRRKGFVPK